MGLIQLFLKAFAALLLDRAVHYVDIVEIIGPHLAAGCRCLAFLLLSLFRSFGFAKVFGPPVELRFALENTTKTKSNLLRSVSQGVRQNIIRFPQCSASCRAWACSGIQSD